ncbi:retrovirus-related Pol polyprotein from transposon 17.6 [Caerostris extrusa]|uniref:Retrovirus-related Pol polyprotein from transposon 17.6 n=1 Tax=Caerostris extrusa TaxID=172846 RepID=A0AAV4VV15_CAEEX|nr:retrovirus-related Pol polyprotein from transposon 17.6 [Caerostris extrusa]
MIDNPSSLSEAVEFTLSVEKSIQIVFPNVNAIAGKESNMTEATSEGFAKSLRCRCNITFDYQLRYPDLLVKKSDWSFRVVADPRKLNGKTIPNNFPLPNLNEIIDVKILILDNITRDFTSGPHQMLMNLNHAYLTGITI